jgi:transcription-repair coupling factor (superfamily II helicase)
MKQLQLTSEHRAQLYTNSSLSSSAFLAEGFFSHLGIKVGIFLGSSSHVVETWVQDFLFFKQQRKDSKELFEIKILPELTDPQDERYLNIYGDCLSVLNSLKQATSGNQQLVIATTAKGLSQLHPLPQSLENQELVLNVGAQMEFHVLVKQLSEQFQYDSEALCERPGQFAVRGGIIDVYPLNAVEPYRIDFYGDEIESIRSFDPTTQRSEKGISTLKLYASPKKALVNESSGSLVHYLTTAVSWFVHEAGIIEAAAPELFQYPERIQKHKNTFVPFVQGRSEYTDYWFGFTDLETRGNFFSDEIETFALPTERLDFYRASPPKGTIGFERLELENKFRSTFINKLYEWSQSKYEVCIILANTAEEERLYEILKEELPKKKFKPQCIQGILSEGFKWDLSIYQPKPELLKSFKEKYILVTADQIFGRKQKPPRSIQNKRLPRRAQVDQLLDFSELVDGDYLVHLQHGICIYRGLNKIEAGGKRIEVISLEFEGAAILHLRIHESHLLFRYVKVNQSTPKLGKLGTNQWEKVRQSTERGILDFAAELLSLQAKRSHLKGHQLGPDNQWQKDFENSFPHQETPDQLKAIEATKIDLEKGLPMDRLICGDVGFGKTEVAIRTAFKAVMEGYQVAFLCPTTVLTQQHFNTFRERMAEYPIVVEMLSRFRSPKEQKSILKQLESGKIDIVVGTHSLLSPKIRFAKLGLLIIDEEHRFGVAQKEQIKRFKEMVHVLCMSATPIPRSLHMALVGARDLSVIETPPKERLPIQTLIRTYNLDVIKEAITYEKSRGGQVFYLHNRIDTIEKVVETLSELVSNITVVGAHGQLDESMLEEIMTRFINGQYDVLVCTTIIESGLDIPNCNTIIIESADHFGLSQLYQLRGRIGRFNRQAYCYLLIHKHAQLLGHAKERLSILEQCNQLGAGFRIAMKDLELRGAGNILGIQQSGHIAAVGFDLYCQLLHQSVARLKGEPVAQRIRAQVRLDFIILGDRTEEPVLRNTWQDDFTALKAANLEGHYCERIEAKIPTDYIAEPRLRIEFYRQFMLAPNLSELKSIESNLKDRFGKMPKALQAFIKINEIRCLAEEKGIILVETEANLLKCRLVSNKETYITFNGRFPRLTRNKPFLRLDEIKDFLLNLHEHK